MQKGFIRFPQWFLADFKIFTLGFLSFLLAGADTLAQSYCTSAATSSADSNVGLVTLNTINNNTTGICATYSNFTAISTNLTIGSNYALTVTAGTCGGNYTKYGKVYIDYNRNFVFTDPGEEVFQFGPAPATQNFSTTINIPGAALLGATRMRVVVVETGSVAGVNSCGNYTWGETEDYTVNIMPSAPNDMGVSSITAPNSGCNLGSAELVSIIVSNFGTNTQTSWSVSYRVNGGAITTEAMTGSLASGASMPYTFTATANLGVPGSYTIQSWATLTGDAFAGNDSTTKVVTAIPGVNTFPYIENFEAGNGGWISGGTLNSWAYGTPAKQFIIGASSGTKAYVTGGLGTTQHNNNEQSFVLGPCFDFTSLQNPWVSLRIWWYSEWSWDGSNLQYSTNFGTTWINVGGFGDPGNWYNDNTINGNPGGSQEGWSGGAFGNANGSGGWVTAAHRLDGLANVPSVRFRVTFGSDGSVVSDGTAFDDVKISEGPVANLGPDRMLCGGDSIILDGGPFVAFQWSNGGTTRYKTITQANTGTIWVKVTDSLGFYDYDTIVVALSNPIVNIGPDSMICPGDSVVLDAGSHPNGSFIWDGGGTSQTQAVYTAGTHWVQVTDSVGCVKADSMILTLAIPPTLNLGPDTTVCSNTPITLDAGPGPVGTTYQWSNSSNTQVVVVTSSGTYSASVTTPGGCAAIDTVVISHFPSPGVNLGPDRIECGNYQLDAGGGGTNYLWNTSATSQTINASTGGTYSVTVTNQYNCSRSDDVVITMGTVPTVNLGPDQLLCNGQTATLNAGNPGSSYLWSNGSTSQSIIVSTAGTYIIRVTNSDGCQAFDTIQISVSGLTVNLGVNTNVCANSGTVLNAGNPGMTYLWSTGETTQTIFVNQTGSYSVTVTDQLGCNAGDVIIISQVPGITAAIGAPATGSLFQPIQFTDNSTPAATFWSWAFGDGLTSSLQNPVHAYSALGSYTVTLIVSDGSCRDTTNQVVLINSFVGAEEALFLSEFSLYPNPSDGLFHLTVALHQRADLSVSIYDLHGRTVFAESMPRAVSYQKDLDMRHLAKGVYVLSLTSGRNHVFRKLVIE